MTRWDNDTGSATVFACLALAALIALTLLVSQVGAGVVARHRAQSAADLAALSAAAVLVDGADAACAKAEAIAREAGARVVECVVADWDVRINVTANVTLGVFGARLIAAAARAGPVDETA
ncbi:Rv3654c family TadE-like protein [Nocardia camponoti]|uniref:Putative Flp pilus-assembly TadG-like N-terminal domain-containing protein n=1 Tax=Nocardia camponoti TaxID=1616106 RepID=A0A917QPH5_9NOCA|nr:Rv3654c family TadE-like protein [Nocardia camponoti]GGK60604.1 hypothetical protein GCM10011591_36140 [Nocardia camponoti]